jgi:hypothetical protein
MKLCIIIIIISFMQGIYTYMPETNYVPREYSVAAILLFIIIIIIIIIILLALQPTVGFSLVASCVFFLDHTVTHHSR